MMDNDLATSATREIDDGIDVSFIVPAKNEEKNIGPCLDSLLACDKAGLRVEICLVDNGSTDRTVSLARERGVRVLEEPDMSISGLRNHGAKRSRGRYLAFVDADVTIAIDWLRNAVREIGESGVAMVGSSPAIPTGSPWVVRTWRLSTGMRPSHCERDWLASMNMLVRREVFEEMGGFDESLMTCEDVDLGYRVSTRYRIIHDERIRAVHHGEARDLRTFFRKEAWRGAYNYRGLGRHGLRAGELPSLIQPLLTISGLCVLTISMWRSNAELVPPALMLIAFFPLAKAAQTALRTGAWHAVPALLVIWTTYSLARSWSAVLEARHALVGR